MSNTNYKIGLEPVELENANKHQKELLERAEKENGMIPNMYKNMVNLSGLMETYETGYKRFREQSGFTPAEQEVVFLSLSVDNDCNYCTAAHSFIADNMSNTPKEVTNAIREGKEIPDDKMATLSKFTRIMNETRGNPSREDVNEFQEAGYSEKQILAIILAQATKTISNYSNHIFHTKLDETFSGRKVETS